MFDVGFWEVSLIGVLALIIIGPERLPGVARTAGTWLGKARRMMTDIKMDIKSELDEADLDSLKSIGKDIQDAGQAFKSQVESGEEKLKTQGSAMDNAITEALNKPMTTADPNWAYPADDTTAKKDKKEKKAKKAGDGKKTARKKKTTKEKAAKKVAKTSAVKNKATKKKAATETAATPPPKSQKKQTG